MPRRKREVEQSNHDRWLVSYADFITLLFAFFVVMYSISSINDGKYRVLSDTLVKAFVEPVKSVDPVQLGDEMRSLVPTVGEYPSLEPATTSPQPEEVAAPDQGPGVAPPTLDTIRENLEHVLAPFMDQELVTMTQTDRGIEVEMRSKMLYKSGSARLSASAYKALRDVAGILKGLPNKIHVEGHTDDIPINTISFPSNWELSAARAASVVHLFTKLGVDSTRMAATGYGEFQPIADNATEAGRQTNRRVSLIIMAGERERVSGRVGKSSRGGS